MDDLWSFYNLGSNYYCRRNILKKWRCYFLFLFQDFRNLFLFRNYNAELFFNFICTTEQFRTLGIIRGFKAPKSSQSWKYSIAAFLCLRFNLLLRVINRRFTNWVHLKWVYWRLSLLCFCYFRQYSRHHW